MTSAIKICSPQLGLSPESDLGGEVYDREIIRGLADLGVKIIVILPKNKKYPPHKNLKVYQLPFPFIWPAYLFNFLIIPYLFWLYKKEKFNLMRIHSPYFTGLGGLFFKLFYPQMPLVTTYHHLEEDRPFFDFINKLVIKRWSVIITDSYFSKQEIVEKYGLKPQKIKIIYPGVDRRLKAKKKKGSLVKKYQLGKKKTLLFLGRLDKRKNAVFLLKLINSLDCPNFKLLICGQGKLKGELVNLCQTLGLRNKVVFTGFVPEKDKADYYNLADLFLFPSKKEGFGLSVMEASRCGVPSIVSDVSSLKELVINGETGYLAKVNRLKDWKFKAERLLKKEKLRKKMGQSALAFSQKFSWSKAGREQLLIYKNLLKKSN